MHRSETPPVARARFRPASAALAASLALAMAAVPAPGSGAEGWSRTTWNGEAAWVAAQGAVRAVVSQERSRLIYLGSGDGMLNLLNAPTPMPRRSEADSAPNLGGHRAWLGPQALWKWPPPGQWEHAPAARVSAAGPVLTVIQPQSDPAYPALTREYAWEAGRLRCSVRWRDDGRPYFAIQIVTVDAPLSLKARLARSPGVPAGAVAARMIDPEDALALPRPAVAVAGDCATVVSGIETVKLGFAPQPLSARRPGGWTLSVHPGPCLGIPLDAPDRGCLSQVWVGGPGQNLAEIEQLSRRLRGDSNGNCGSTIYLEATPPKNGTQPKG